MQKSFKLLSVSSFTLLLLVVNSIFLPKTNFAQQLIWTHTGGPMGGIIGAVTINSQGEIYAGAYHFWIDYSELYNLLTTGIAGKKSKLITFI